MLRISQDSSPRQKPFVTTSFHVKFRTIDTLAIEYTSPIGTGSDTKQNRQEPVFHVRHCWLGRSMHGLCALGILPETKHITPCCARGPNLGRTCQPKHRVSPLGLLYLHRKMQYERITKSEEGSSIKGTHLHSWRCWEFRHSHIKDSLWTKKMELYKSIPLCRSHL